MRLMKFLIIMLPLSCLISAAAPYKPIKYCSTDAKNDLTYCGKNPGGHPCLFYHPKHEFCEDETAPLPSCCRAADEKGFGGCACCASVYGSKRINSNAHTYQHIQPITEYAR